MVPFKANVPAAYFCLFSDPCTDSYNCHRILKDIEGFLPRGKEGLDGITDSMDMNLSKLWK